MVLGLVSIIVALPGAIWATIELVTWYRNRK